MDELEEPAVTGRRLLLFAGAGVSDGNACFPKRMRVSPPHPEADLLLVQDGVTKRTAGLSRSREGGSRAWPLRESPNGSKR